MQCSPTPYSSPAQWGTQHCCCGKSAFLCTRHPRLTCRFTCSHILWASAPVSVNLCTWSHHLRHMEYLMHTYTPIPQSLLWDTEQTKIKAKNTWGFQQYSPHIDLPERVSKDMRVKAYRKNSAENQVMGFRSRKKVSYGQTRVLGQRKWGAAPVEQPEGQRNPDTQISKKMSKIPYHTHYICWLQALRATCYQTAGVWKVLGKQPQTQGRIMGREENERKKKLDRDQTLPHWTDNRMFESP